MNVQQLSDLRRRITDDPITPIDTGTVRALLDLIDELTPHQVVEKISGRKTNNPQSHVGFKKQSELQFYDEIDDE